MVKTGEGSTLTGKPAELVELSSSRVDETDNFNMPSRTTGDPPGVSTSIGTRSIEQIRERFVVRKRLGNSVQTPEPIILSPDRNQPSGRVVVTTTGTGPNQPAVKSTIASGEVSCVVPDQPPPVREARRRRRSSSSSSSGSRRRPWRSESSIGSRQPSVQSRLGNPSAVTERRFECAASRHRYRRQANRRSRNPSNQAARGDRRGGRWSRGRI